MMFANSKFTSVTNVDFFNLVTLDLLRALHDFKHNLITRTMEKIPLSTIFEV